MNSFTNLARVGVLVAVLAAATSVAGCASHTTPDPDAGVYPETQPPSAPTASTAGSTYEPPNQQPLSAWPDQPFTDSTPFTWKQKDVAIAVGYTAADFRAKMQTTWHLSVGTTSQEKSFNGRTYKIFVDKLTKGKQLLAQVTGIEDAQGSLQQVACDVYVDAPQPAAFLKDCASLDYPNADPAKAAAWEEAYRPLLDADLKDKVSWVESPLFSAGGTSMFLRHSVPTMTADGARLVDELVIFGSGEPDST